MRRTEITLLLILACALSVGCDSAGDVGEPDIAVASITVLPNDAPLVSKGQGVQLQAVVVSTAGDTLAGPSVAWSSSNEDVLGVSQTGLMRGRLDGSATVSASMGGKTGSATFRVLDLTGTWTGSLVDPNGFWPGIEQNVTYVLQQNGSTVTGTFTNSAWLTPGGTGGQGSIEGSLLWNRFGHSIEVGVGCNWVVTGGPSVELGAAGEPVIVHNLDGGATWAMMGTADCGTGVPFAVPLPNLTRQK